MRTNYERMLKAAEDALQVYYTNKPGSIRVPEVDLAYIEGFKEGATQQAISAAQDLTEITMRTAEQSWTLASKQIATELLSWARLNGYDQKIIDKIRSIGETEWLSTL